MTKKKKNDAVEVPEMESTAPKNQNQGHNTKKQALGPNTKR